MGEAAARLKALHEAIQDGTRPFGGEALVSALPALTDVVRQAEIVVRVYPKSDVLASALIRLSVALEGETDE